MFNNHHRIVGFLRPVFVLVLPRSPAMKKCVFFRLAIFLPPKKKNPRGDAAGEILPQNRQKEKATRMRGLCCLSVTKKIPGNFRNKKSKFQKSFTIFLL